MYIKGFDKDLKCRGFQFEIGKIYDTGYTDNLELCTKRVFHFCDSIKKVNEYYACNTDNRYCEIEVLGSFITDNNNEKCGSNKIKIVREIMGEELDILLKKINGNTGLFNVGSYNTGHKNTGYWNAGDCNTGNWNSGDKNTGNYNTGDFNTGHCNRGSFNTGDFNTGSFNTGSFNRCHFSNGFFNTKEPTIKIFNIDSGMTASEFRKSKYWKILTNGNFKLTEWKGGYLKVYTYKEACSNWWKSLREKDKETIMNIPNFNKDIFKEITGIDLNLPSRNKIYKSRYIKITNSI